MITKMEERISTAKAIALHSVLPTQTNLKNENKIVFL